jgi:hypothetical protein
MLADEGADRPFGGSHGEWLAPSAAPPPAPPTLRIPAPDWEAEHREEPQQRASVRARLT